MNFQDIAVLVIAGGRSSRMGRDKRFLALAGCSMLERMLKKTAAIPFRERYLCGAEASEKLVALCSAYGLAFVADARPAAGPLEGIRSGLARLQADYVLAVSCDMPLFAYEHLRPLLAAAAGELAIIPVVGGRRQPLAGLYHRQILPVVERALEQGANKIGQVIEQVPHKLVELADSDAFFNVNTPADFRLVQGRLLNERRPVPMITVSAPQSNTGKTTFIEKLIPHLKEQGLRVGVVKGDCHGYDVDEKGKDSWRFRQAGADGVAVVSPSGYFIQQRTEQRASLLAIAERLTDVDVVLLESRSHGTAPKISLWRGLGNLVVDDDTVAVFSSGEHRDLSVRQYDLDDIAAAVRLVQFLCAR
ncbi:molybdopterin-guanine dinucleotide biosynthesis protein B [Selenomonas ruminantium]|uniref:molybdopterin-guanine dinucleotide biosynthesis protein B n=1 Tax=Selenomonas ruminantium TaxID=971 RepID=UPI001569DF6B|nr:molybdopterin-guanine dinucleotide biosynthesis protein B [Selenomonas ruminantium]